MLIEDRRWDVQRVITREDRGFVEERRNLS
jgi:hypothetical protein